jgi:hypothetical protein
VIVADEERAGIDAGVQAAVDAGIGLHDPDALNRMAAAFVEPDTARGLAPRGARVVGQLKRGPPPGAFSSHREAPLADMCQVVHLAALQ